MGKKNRTANKIKNSKIMSLIEDSYIGIIEDVDDEKFQGRCKIRVYGVYGDKDNSLGSIPTKDLPWAYPLHGLIFGSSSGTGKFSSPKKDTKVRVVFEEDQYHPRYFSIEEIDEELRKELEKDYSGFQSLLYDSDDKVKILYAKKTGLLLELDSSIINIEPNGAVVVNHKQSSATIELRGDTITMTTNNAVDISTPNTITTNSNFVHVNGTTVDVGANAIYSAVNGEIMMKLILALATGLDAKMPQSPGQFTTIVQAMEQLILSKTVNTTP